MKTWLRGSGAVLALKSPVLLAIIAGIFPLSLATFGGVNVILPALYRLSVEQMHWLDATAFYDLLALAFAAPGPNMLFVAMIGSRVAGVPGAIVATLTMILPPCLLLGIVSHWWFRATGSRLQKLLQNAVLPITTGIFASASYSILHAVVHGPLGLAISIVTLVVTLRTKIHPLWLLALGGLIGSVTRV